MFGKLFNRKKEQVKLFYNTDIHCHILPGVDDGVQTMEESLEILCRYEAWGVRAVWCTPHIMEDYPNATADLRQRFEELKEAYRKENEERLEER